MCAREENERHKNAFMESFWEVHLKVFAVSIIKERKDRCRDGMKGDIKNLYVLQMYNGEKVFTKKDFVGHKLSGEGREN